MLQYLQPISACSKTVAAFPSPSSSSLSVHSISFHFLSSPAASQLLTLPPPCDFSFVRPRSFGGRVDFRHMPVLVPLLQSVLELSNKEGQITALIPSPHQRMPRLRRVFDVTVLGEVENGLKLEARHLKLRQEVRCSTVRARVSSRVLSVCI